MKTKRLPHAISASFALCALMAQAEDRPNFLIMWGDDIGITNISTYSMGVMGYKTPNIDRIGKEGVTFTDYYGDQSCTAGRSSFITGQTPLRTGLSKVGLPGAAEGISERDITIAEYLKDKGYATGQFGKNHLGDRNEHLPTQHGFDEFYGNLYHLNAEEEPEDEDYPQAAWFKKRFGPRGVIHSFSDGRVQDTGPLTRKRMETVDADFVDKAQQFIARTVAQKQPFFVWLNTTGMHFRTHRSEATKGLSGQGFYNDVMVAHDGLIGKMLDQLDELDIADNTFVMYSTDNGVHYNTWPDAGITPYRSEKNSNWEGAYRVPALVRWPAKIEAGTISNQIVSHLDWFPTFAGILGDKTLATDLKQGKRVIAGKQSKLHLDGYNLAPYLTGKSKQSARNVFHYLDDQGKPVGVRVGDWKVVYSENRAKTMALWAEPNVSLRLPKLFNLRRDPYERADENSNTYWDWYISKAAWLYMGLAQTSQYLATFQAYPPSQLPGTWSIDRAYQQVMEQTKHTAKQ